MDKLTLEHLAPYLPYEIELFHEGNKRTHLLDIDIKRGIYERKMSAVTMQSMVVGFSKLKPILRPLSDLTVEFFKENIDDAIVDFLINCEPEHNHFSVEVCDKVIGWTAISYEEYQLFFKNHFDVFGLIEKGLAIDINSIEGKETNS